VATLARRLPLTAPTRSELMLGAGAGAATALIALAGVHKLGTEGLVAPLALVAALILLARPLAAIALVFVLVVVCETTFGIFTFTAKVYEVVVKDISLVDMLVILAVASVALDLMRTRRRLYVPRALVVPLVTLALAMVTGVVVGHAAGASLRFAVASEDVLGYLLLLPLAVCNLDIDRRKVTWLLGGALALAGLKALLGMVEIALHRGPSIEGVAQLTYYEPTANWLIMIAILSVFAAVLARAKPRLWVLLSSPLLIACLLLSYRRSFWIAAALGGLLVLVLGTSPHGRRLLVPIGLGLAAAVWLLGSVHYQGATPLVKRATSLSPTRIQNNAEDRYRLNERTDVIANIEAHPIAGLGVTIPWKALPQTLAVEGAAAQGQGHSYVHFALLWYWLKLGVLGALAYIGFQLSAMWIAWRAWRTGAEPLLRAFGLASLCGVVGLLAMDTTASFTGVEGRFTVVYAVQVGLLALIARPGGLREPAPAPDPSSPGPALTAPMRPAMR
jgi:O-Antigen ligase